MYAIDIPSASEYPELIDLWEASVRATHDFLSNEDILYFKKRICNGYLDLLDLYSAKDSDGKILGFFGLSEEKIQMLYIDPRWMGKGIGKFLLNYAITQKEAFLVDVNEQNTQAVGFYQKMGFRVIKRNPIDSEGKPFAILEMALKNAS
jgi:putative acetyltransferase